MFHTALTDKIPGIEDREICKSNIFGGISILFLGATYPIDETNFNETGRREE